MPARLSDRGARLAALAATSLLALGPLAAPGRAAAAPAQGGEERARTLEQLGRFAEAAEAYQKAWLELRAPELLYRLAVCRRHLGDYAAAREAMRGYLREAPGGGLRIEAERQLAQLQVLIEERGLHPENARPGRKPAAGKTGTAKPHASAAAAAAAPTGAVSAPVSAPVSASVSAPVSASASASVSAPVSASVSAPEAAAVAAPVPASALGPAAVAAAAQPASFAAALPPTSARLPAPAQATAGPTPALALRPALPWLAAAGALAAGGALLCWDGARVAGDLDGRFATGDLTAADSSRYDRAHREGLGGRALLGLAVVAAALGALAVAW